MSNKYVVVDLETTGNAPKKGDKIIQFAAVVIEDGKITKEYSSLVNPDQPIPPFIEELTGLTDQMVKTAPFFSEIAEEINDLLEDAYFVAHNVLFDLSFLQEELINAGYIGFYGPVLDTVELARILLPSADSYKLSELSQSNGIIHDRPHQADSDSYATAELLLLLLNKLEKLPKETVKQLFRLSGGLKSDLYTLLEELLQEKETKLEETPPMLEIFRGIAICKQEDSEVTSNNVSELDETFEQLNKEFVLNKGFERYEKREGQLTMMNSVNHALRSSKHALIEAGTGVGKSIAYLLPAVYYGRETKNPIIISTYTTQLQDQLLTNDIPKLNKMLPFQVNAALIKGRGHYISMEKFEHTLKEREDNYDTALTKMQILVWLTETKTGDVDELNLSSGGSLFWNRIKNDLNVFIETKEWKSRDFYSSAKKRANGASVIITNHSLLLSDLTAEKALLPKYQHVVVDEAHHFVKAAGKHLGKRFDYLTIRILLSQIGLLEQNQLLNKLEKLLSKQSNHTVKTIPAFEFSRLMTALTESMDELFKMIGIYAKRHSSVKSHQNRIKVLFEDAGHNKESQYVKANAERFLFSLKDVLHAVNGTLEKAALLKELLAPEEKILLEETAMSVLKLEEIASMTRSLFLRDEEDSVIWIEMDQRAAQNATSVLAEPIETSAHLKERFFAVKESVVLTSATLVVNHSFQYILNQIGLTKEACLLNQIPSPFQYKKQMKLVVPTDLPEINAVPLEDYVASITEHIITISEATKGRMLILFTSYEMLRKTYELIKESGLLEGYALFAQGISGGSRTRLTRNFQRFEKSILFGTSSFWEGVDIPGDDLSCLIIVRLPFTPPDEPIHAAKSEHIRKQGGNSFYEYSLPEAVLRFKQGFGRLIRTEQDRGFILVFDRRIVTTKYGRAFLESVPAIDVQEKNINETVQLIEKWL
ncbi:ATP-dependent DNA helicase DinG [Cytobacillus gottheilii]|uniref:3'-5' exonuclease DinG n=1 Tax=Cytobacillus gottheilii TaxID=859144 RepID=A0ABX8F9H2_9BACI|nr:ATP-dependent DNA helicase DinG [Cytobacillus gottheilii]QVY60142.1 ATP-dependent DNA helicase DinG [Cytobacillus gottheilii]